jgi:DeoR/GlpR family transcriptional regulator of sugar metabolism
MRQAVELRAKGFSLRAIAAHLGASHETVRRDLRSWDERQEVSRFAVADVTAAVTNATAKCDNNVVQIRRGVR